MNSPMLSCSSSAQTSVAAQKAEEGEALQPAQRCEILSSELLLAGRAAVVIDHHGERYTLRATRSGKLILTK